jgi:hypothetical protein
MPQLSTVRFSHRSFDKRRPPATLAFVGNFPGIISVPIIAAVLITVVWLVSALPRQGDTEKLAKAEKWNPVNLSRNSASWVKEKTAKKQADGRQCLRCCGGSGRRELLRYASSVLTSRAATLAVRWSMSNLGFSSATSTCRSFPLAATCRHTALITGSGTP